MTERHAFGLLLIALTASLGGSRALAQAADNPVQATTAECTLTNAASVRDLAPDEADRRLPVRLQGVVTFVFDRRSCFVQDSSAGIFVGNGEECPAWTPGDAVIIEGVTSAGEYAPIVRPTAARVVGRMNLPPAKHVTYEDLITGREDSQWVEVDGLVRSVFGEPSWGGILEVATGGGRLTAFVPNSAESNLTYLVDYRIRLRGVCGTWFNKQRQLFGIRLMVADPREIVVVEPGATNALAQPAQPIGNLMRFTPHASSYGRRVKVVGTVTLQQPGRALFVQGEQYGLYVQTRQSGRLQPGDRVELVGFPAKGDYTPMLEDATWQKIGSGPDPEPTFVKSDEALAGLHDSRLVAIEGRLFNRTQNNLETVLVMETEDRLFSAHLDAAAGHSLAALQNGSRLRLTGVCRIEVGEGWRAGAAWRAKSFRILMRSPADAQVLALPPWWTLTRLLWAVGILMAVVLVSLTWAALLRRKVSQQTTIIRRQFEQEAALKERYQDLFENANDMVYTHDLSGRITTINVAGEALLGRDRGFITQSRLVDFIAEEQRSAANAWLEHIVDGTAPATVEWDVITALGERVRLEISTRLFEREGRQVEVEGIARDVTERRRLEKEILEASTREQRRIGHDLHDGVCQQLAGIGLLSDILADKLEEQKRPEAAEAHNITELVNKANKQTRGVARGLFPVRLEENGLVSALEELAENAGAFFNTQCEFRCDAPIAIRDLAVAHHLYYIAQEAILNAVKHGKARHIEVSLAAAAAADGGYVLTVRDDGVGLPTTPTQNRGMGIRIMKYRARMVGAEVRLSPRPTGGTEMECRFAGESKAWEKATATASTSIAA